MNLEQKNGIALITGRDCERFDGSTFKCNSVVERALNKTSLSELVCGVG